MPAERRTFTSTRPVKTERTHEENQERAYIAASRRSDRSLEARIESARRASEIHKKRTGRALRVTEQDVINEEMYEEEDDDLPTQYQRLNAHLHTTSVMFNKKLHDYIATQHGVRNMFMSQYQNQGPAFPQFGQQYPANGASLPQASNWLNPSMLPPQQFTPASPQSFQQAQPFSPTSTQPQQGYRQSPYHIPQRTQSHQRALSIQLPHGASHFDPSAQPASAGTTTPQTELNRRLSLPPQAFQQSNQTVERPTRPSLSRSPTAHSLQHRQSSSPQIASPNAASVHDAATAQSDPNTPTSYSYSPTNYAYSSQALNSNPLTLSMPPESQQFLGSVLDQNDPRTAIFMAGSDNLPQPFAPTYTYNPNKVTRTPSSASMSENATGSAQTLSSGLDLKTEPVSDTTSLLMPSAISDGFYSNDSFLTPGNGDYSAFFDFQGGDFTQSFDDQSANDQDNGNSLVNWD
ncbi:hypothetical protein AA0111_g7435 [Alternaria arborescens]|uniref:hypothetical protein n=1 Tax=Alternaria arborescens TaxID=156630 RepID=UPI001075749B|nr:hypothetical protein AA0111_g7435 [Alternaria arborescens]RYO27117.1 hypothetical protein AA0111_g7435 [Alternaria arborescens]